MGFATQKYMGRNRLIDRLSEQVGDREMAVNILRDRGMVSKDSEELTKKGLARDAMTAQERAIDRASKGSGRNKTEYVYNPRTNRATLKQGKV